MKKPNGFTLVELLTVIAIIVLLVSIFLPSLQNVKRQSNSVACQSNLRNGINFFPIALVLVNPNDILVRLTIGGKFLVWAQLRKNPDFYGNYVLNVWVCDIRHVSDTCQPQYCWISHTCINQSEDNAKGILTGASINNIDQKELRTLK